MVGRIVGEGEKTRYYLDNRPVSKAEFDAVFPDRPVGGKALSATPARLSDALAVHPKQVAEAIEDAKKKGVPTDFTLDGRPIIRSRAHQKAYLKAYGFYNKDGGYGD